MKNSTKKLNTLKIVETTAAKNVLSKADLEKVKGGGGAPKQFSTLVATQEDMM